MPPMMRSVAPRAPSGQPPIVLVHGAANSAPVWTYWQEALAARGRASHAVELRGHGSEPYDLSRTTMQDYVDDVLTAIATLEMRPVVMGWSMGGLVAMMAAAQMRTAACVALAPSTPAQAVDPAGPLVAGEYGPEFYGITSRDPHDQPAMPDLEIEERALAIASLCKESNLARDERRRGIVITSLACPLLIVTGGADRLWPASKYAGLWLAHDHLDVPGASHWGLVLSRRAVEGTADDVAAWLDARSIARGR